MAYRSRSGRGNGGGGRRSSGGSGGNPAALLGAIAVVVGIVVVVIVVMSGKKDGPPAPSPTPPPAAPTPQGPKAPTPPPPPPFPPIDVAQIQKIRAEVKGYEPLIKKGEALYDEAMNAKRAGKDDLWQEKLREAAEPYEQVQDMWNEIISSMPSSPHYNEEEIANHYLGDEGNKVTKALSTLAAIKKQRRIQ